MCGSASDSHQSAACLNNALQCSAASVSSSCADSSNTELPHITIKLKHLNGSTEDYTTYSSCTLGSIKHHVAETRGAEADRIRLISPKHRRQLTDDTATLQYADVLQGDVLFVVIRFGGGG